MGRRRTIKSWCAKAVFDTAGAAADHCAPAAPEIAAFSGGAWTELGVCECVFECEHTIVLEK